jgi:transcriptional regulator
MYQPPQFKSRDAAIAAELVRAHPFASLISVDGDGLPFVTHLPLHLQEREGSFCLLGHCARGNPHWRYLQERPTAVVTFLGPHAYLSPTVYPDRARVPTWTYLAVHCTVRAALIDDAAAKDRLLKQLIADHEPSYAEQWRSLDADFAAKMLAGIVGFELQVIDLQCKLKLNQHRPEAHVAMKRGYAAGNERERELAGWMERLGMGG